VLNNAISDVAFGLYAFKASEDLKPCPYCGSPIEKNGGCSHMKCTRCGKDYDWRQCRLYVESKTAWSKSLTSSIKLTQVNPEAKKNLMETLKSLDHTLVTRQNTKSTGRRKGARRRGMLAEQSSTSFQNKLSKLYSELDVVVKR